MDISGRLCRLLITLSDLTLVAVVIIPVVLTVELTLSREEGVRRCSSSASWLLTKDTLMGLLSVSSTVIVSDGIHDVSGLLLVLYYDESILKCLREEIPTFREQLLVSGTENGNYDIHDTVLSVNWRNRNIN